MESSARNATQHPASDENGSRSAGLTDTDVAEFKRLVHECCGIALDDARAWNRATALVALYRMLLGPIPEDPALREGSNVVQLSSSAPRKVS